MARVDKINQQLKREISVLIQQELSDPRLHLVTIISAYISRDLKSAKIYFSVLGDAKLVEQAQNGLDAASGLLRRYIGQTMKLRFTPELSFVYDRTIEVSAKIESTLKEIKDEFKKNN